jgi:glutamate-1-semialdehyde aminotransferase
LRQRLTELVVENDYPVAVVGESSLFMVRFVSHDVKSQRDLVGENKVAHNHLYPYLCKHGVFIPHGHFGLLSAAHSQQDIQKIVESYRCSLHDMRTDGLL